MSIGSRWASYTRTGPRRVRRTRTQTRTRPRTSSSGTGSTASRGSAVDTLGRVGFAARGVVYLLIGWISLLIALDHRTMEADRTGALELIAGKPFGFVVLWFLIVGFAGMALWRAVMAVHPDLPGKNKAGSRLASAGKAVLYAVAAYTTARFTFTGHASGSTNQESTDFTTDAMRNSGGRLLVGAVGVGLVIGGLVLIKRGIEKSFVKNLRTGSMSPKTRRRVLALGAIGNVARGVVIGGAGVFLIDAAVTFDPKRARGIDGTLRALAAAPAGPVLLIVMAFGLAAFGLYSFCEARWRRL
ncbi:MAG TPA: DUF1206 domain-containing protein [Actinospica sp.]|nr:DUF1206 domain-containing protein [Actinospica sp.]